MPDATKIPSPFLGCIADDITGATDLAINLVQGGLRVVQVMSVPSPEQLQSLDVDAVVVALKTRSRPAADAVGISLDACDALMAAGCKRLFFKYCSTFDSTPAGNIGPVAEALLDRVGSRQTVFCPAFPRNVRTVYQGHLFVGQALLSESGMEDHPINPMRDANLLRVLSAQAQRQVGLLALNDVEAGAERIRGRLASLLEQGAALVIADACSDDHLATLAEAFGDLRLITGGSGIARFLPEAYRSAGLLAATEHSARLPTACGRAAILAGSCSAATQRQVLAMQSDCCRHEINVRALLDSADAYMEKLLSWAAEQHNAPEGGRPLIIYSTSTAARVEAIQREFGRERVAESVELFHGRLAQALVDQLGVRKLIVAGGETSGAVVAALGIDMLRIGPEICAGVPWTESKSDDPSREGLALAFKSGNFGSDSFFSDALNMLSG